MNRPRLLLIAALAVFALASPVRADLIGWSYSWSPGPGSGSIGAASTSIPISSGGSVTMTGSPVGTAAGNSYIVATNLQTVSSASAGTPDTLASGGQYSLTLTLTDSTSLQSNTLTFQGQLAGSFSALSSNITNTFLAPTSQQLVLGGNTYTVSLTSFLPPGPPGSSRYGAIGAYVSVSAPGGSPGPSSIAPEPSSLLLCGFGAAGCALAGWRRRRAAARLACAR